MCLARSPHLNLGMFDFAFYFFSSIGRSAV